LATQAAQCLFGLDPLVADKFPVSNHYKALFAYPEHRLSNSIRSWGEELLTSYSTLFQLRKAAFNLFLLQIKYQNEIEQQSITPDV
jgi:hypothetical protein